MSNVMSMKKLRNHVHRNGFDLSRRNAFTAKVGELLPVLCEEVIPGDKFKIKPEWFTRTRPLNTAAYTRVREYYDFYFVPYRVLWKHFDNFITKMDNPVTASSYKENSATSSQMPHTSTGQLLYYMKNLKVLCDNQPKNPASNTEVGLNRFYASCKLLNYLNYGSIERQLAEFDSVIPGLPGDTDLEINIMPLLAYQKIYQDMYRNSQWEKSAAYTWNVDYLGNDFSNTEFPTAQLKYDLGDAATAQEYRANLFDMRYCSWNKDMLFGLLPSPQFGDTAFAPIGINNNLSAVTSVAKTVNYDTSPDGVYSGAPVTWKQSGGRAGYLLAGDPSVSEEFIQHSHSATTSLNGSISSNGLSVLALRQAEALQKWKEISLSGSKDFRSQMHKHWGVDVGSNRSDRCQYVGGSVSNVTIGEVVNNNITSDNVADIAGKGVGSGQGSIDFESKDYGVFMCIYHAMPLLDYESVGIKRFNTKITPNDFAIPEFDSVGMQQLLLYQFCYTKPLLVFDGVPSVTKPLGYAPRYLEYKTAVDEVHGGFMSQSEKFLEQQGFPAWVAPLNYNWLSFLVEADVTSLTYSDFKVKPTILDSIFSGTIAQEQEDGTVKYDNTLATDQLLCNCFFDFKAVRNLDYNGLPY